MSTQSKNRNRTSGMAALAGLALATTGAHAAIVGQGGNVGGPWYGPPASLRLNKQEHNKDTQVWVEQQNMVLPSNVWYNAHNPGTYQQVSSLVHQTIPGAGTSLVNSYIFHFDPTSGFPTKESKGYVDFNHEFYVITKNGDIDSSDIPFGMPGTQYATGLLADRGYDLAAKDAFWISQPSAGVWRLDFQAFASTGMDELRVIEIVGSVPTPGSLALLGGAGLAACRRRR